VEVLFDAGSFVFLFEDLIDEVATLVSLVSQRVYRVRGVNYYFLNILVLGFC
jgi:hypothetical protein